MKTLAALLAFGVCAFPCFGQAPAVAGGPVNSASFSAQAVAPGSLVSIFGTRLATAAIAASSIPLPFSLGGVSVKVNDTVVPLAFVSAGQINFQMPWDVLPGSSTSGTAMLTVTRDGIPSQPRQFPVRAVAPGIFRAGGDQAVAVNADGSVVARVGSLPGAFAHPARPGDTILIYATGLGAVRPAPVLGAGSTDALRTALSPPVFTVASLSAAAPFAGLSPQFAGVNQINLTIPPTVEDGDWLKLQIKSADGSVSDAVTIAVESLPSGTAMPEEQRSASLDAIQGYYVSLGTFNPQDNNAKLVSFLKSRPELKNVTVHRDGNVSVQWTDGVALTFFQNTTAPYPNRLASGAALSAAPAITGPRKVAAVCPGAAGCNPAPVNGFASQPDGLFTSVPASNKARLIFGFSFQFNDPTPKIGDWLKQAGYDVQIDKGTVDDFRSIGGEGILFIGTHGGLCSGGGLCLGTTTLYNRLVDATLAIDRLDGSLELATAPGVPKPFYAITPKFIRKHWKPLSANSFVYIDACDGLPLLDNPDEDSDDVDRIALRQAIFDKNASVYAGWNAAIQDGPGLIDYNTSLLVFDRLLGANSLDGDLKHTPDERPFPLREIVNDLTLHPGIGYDPVNDGYLGFSLNPQQSGNGFGILKPSIHRVSSFELTNELLINGFFGDPPMDSARQPIIRVDGVPYFPEDNGGFKPDRIAVKIPQIDPPVAGQVTVEYGATISNPATLSYWQGTFDEQHIDVGTLAAHKMMKIAFRADVRTARPHIHLPPTEPKDVPFFAIKGGTFTYSTDGKAVCGPTNGSQNITEITGSGSLAPLDFVTSRWAAQGVVADSHTLLLQFLDGINSLPVTIRYTLTNPPGPSQVQSLPGYLLPMPGDFQDPGVKVSLNSNYNIVGSTAKSTQPGYPFALCPNASATEQVVWPAIAVHFPPNSTSAR